jgi:hypothetical protein
VLECLADFVGQHSGAEGLVDEEQSRLEMLEDESPLALVAFGDADGELVVAAVRRIVQRGFEGGALFFLSPPGAVHLLHHAQPAKKVQARERLFLPVLASTSCKSPSALLMA